MLLVENNQTKKKPKTMSKKKKKQQKKVMNIFIYMRSAVFVHAQWIRRHRRNGSLNAELKFQGNVSV